MSTPIKIAVSKGYLWQSSLKLFSEIGIFFEDDLSESRKLSTVDTSKTFELQMVRPWDVVSYVEGGAADLGIVGYDVLHELEPNIAQLLDLKFGGCKLVIAGLAPLSPDQLEHNLRIATKYTHSTISYFRKKGLKINPIKLYGAIELGPLTGLSDLICDLTATGKTLEENNLHIIDTIFSSTARLVANKSSLKTLYTPIKELTEKFNHVVSSLS